MRGAAEGEGGRPPLWDAERVRHLVESAPDDFYCTQKRCACGWGGEATVWFWEEKEPSPYASRLLWKCPECHKEHVWEHKEEDV